MRLPRSPARRANLSAKPACAPHRVAPLVRLFARSILPPATAGRLLTMTDTMVQNHSSRRQLQQSTKRFRGPAARVSSPLWTPRAAALRPSRCMHVAIPRPISGACDLGCMRASLSMHPPSPFSPAHRDACRKTTFACRNGLPVAQSPLGSVRRLGGTACCCWLPSLLRAAHRREARGSHLNEAPCIACAAASPCTPRLSCGLGLRHVAASSQSTPRPDPSGALLLLSARPLR